jgi:hypothetical protein
MGQTGHLHVMVFTCRVFMREVRGATVYIGLWVHVSCHLTSLHPDNPMNTPNHFAQRLEFTDPFVAYLSMLFQSLLSQHLPVDTEERNKILWHDGWKPE